MDNLQLEKRDMQWFILDHTDDTTIERFIISYKITIEESKIIQSQMIDAKTTIILKENPQKDELLIEGI